MTKSDNYFGKNVEIIDVIKLHFFSCWYNSNIVFSNLFSKIGEFVRKVSKLSCK